MIRMFVCKLGVKTTIQSEAHDYGGQNKAQSLFDSRIGRDRQVVLLTLGA